MPAMTTLDNMNATTHAEHWTATASDAQKLRAEAGIIAAAILRSNGPLVGKGHVQPVDVMILGDWILDGSTEIEEEIVDKLCRVHNPDGPENCWMKTGHNGRHSWQVDTVDTMESTTTQGAT